MNARWPSAARLRHIVFAHAAKARTGVVNFSPVAPPPHPEDSTQLPFEDEAFLRWLFGVAGIDVRAYRMETLKRRLPSCLRVLRVDSTAQARKLLLQNPHLVKGAISAMIIGVSAFFRDPPVFQKLRGDVLPMLASGRRGLRVWSIGCSEGQELYSVGLLLAEMRVLHCCQLLGTDCRSDAAEFARLGLYDESAVKNVPPEMIGRYFLRTDLGWQVLSTIRSALHWRTGNVLTTLEPGEWDMILCRNLSIYLQPEVTARLWVRLESALRPGGVLVVGKAERPTSAPGFRMLCPCVYSRVGG